MENYDNLILFLGGGFQFTAKKWQHEFEKPYKKDSNSCSSGSCGSCDGCGGCGGD